MAADTDAHTTRGRFSELSVADCQRLLLNRSVGRLAFVTGDGPEIIPVNYVVSGPDIIFRTASYSSLGRHAPQSRVAFEVDDIDESGRAGWSVLVVGTAERIENEEEALELWDSKLLQPWAVGIRTLLIRIRASRTTGRRVVAP